MIMQYMYYFQVRIRVVFSVINKMYKTFQSNTNLLYKDN